MTRSETADRQPRRNLTFLFLCLECARRDRDVDAALQAQRELQKAGVEVIFHEPNVAAATNGNT